MSGLTSIPSASSPGSSKRKPSASLNTNTLLLLIGVSAVSFIAGNIFAMSFNQCSTLSSTSSSLAAAGGEAIGQRPIIAVKQQQQDKPEKTTTTTTTTAMKKEPIFPDTVKKFASGMAHIKKEDFTQKFELGVPLDLPAKGSEDILLLYNSPGAFPNKQRRSLHNNLLELTADEAVENCDHVNMIFTDHEGRRKQCVAILPQYESYHIQKWMRVPEKGEKGKPPKVDSKEELRLVGRGFQPNGVDSFKPPDFQRHTRKSWELLRNYLDSLDDVLEELKPIVNKVKIQNTVIVMVCNHGQSELLVNFACSTHSRGLDISNIVVFATDKETKELAESVGLAAYYDERNFGHIQSKAAEQYGDRQFTAMMMAKVVCVQLISLLGVDILFQDVDIVWYKNPLRFFHNKKSPIYHYDMYYQDDGSHSTRYAPFAPNSGFYFVRHNQKTRHFLTSLLMSGDLVLKTFSHQQAMTAVLAEHASLFGLRVKVLSRDEDDFPGGYHYHRQGGEFLRDMFKGEKTPYIFHMSWTKNKDNKQLFLKQMGEWYLKDHCVAKKLSDINVKEDEFVKNCCSKEALVTCHYKDKPSIKPCKNSPALDKGRPSWW